MARFTVENKVSQCHEIDRAKLIEKLVFIAGGSKGLGRALGVLLASKGMYCSAWPSTLPLRRVSLTTRSANTGANIAILARSKDSLEDARKEILQARRSEAQTVDAISVDLCNAEAVSCHESRSTYYYYRDNS